MTVISKKEKKRPNHAHVGSKNENNTINAESLTTVDFRTETRISTLVNVASK